MSKLIDGWITMWALAYITVALVKPDIYSGIDPVVGAILSLVLGFSMLAGLILTSTKHSNLVFLGCILLFIIGCEETVGGIMSFCGYIHWNVPLDPSLASITMAFMDLIGAAMLFSKECRVE